MHKPNPTVLSRRACTYQTILEGILTNKYPRDQFLTELQLSKEFRVSRLLIRETLIQLQRDGILKAIPRVGYQINPVYAQEIRDAIQTRLILETRGAVAAMGNIHESTIKKLEMLVKDANTARLKEKGSPREWWLRNNDFHITILHESGNKLLTAMVEQTLSILWRAILQYFDIENPRSYLSFQPGTHEKILTALKTKNKSLLLRNLREDILSLNKVFTVL